MSKALEWIIVIDFSEFLTTSDLQFGYKKGVSTSSCTGLIKNVVSRYIESGTPVYGCFLDASKAFDLVDHEILFHRLLDRNLPSAVVRFLWSWYQSQRMCVRWNSSLSNTFSVSNGVRQGGVLSPILFTVYIDELLSQLKASGIGCHWNHHYVGAVCYADDLTLLAPSVSALRLMLEHCSRFAISVGLKFNAAKTQLIRFGRVLSSCCEAEVNFGNHCLHFVDTVTHLGHILRFDLDDGDDIIRCTREMVRKANYMLRSFSCADVLVETKLYQSFCLSLYGCSLWNLSCKSFSIIEVAFNNIIRKIWALPRDSHTRIVHCIANLQSIFNTTYRRSATLLHRVCNSDSVTLRAVFQDSSSLAYTATGFNHTFGNRFLETYFTEDWLCADYIRNYRSTSNKKHFIKNVKECRDVIVKKVLEQGWDTRTTHYTHVGPMTLHRCHQLHDLYCLFV